jgi:hypothetical protein
VVGDEVLADRVAKWGGRTGSRIPAGRLAASLRDGDPLPITFDNERASVTALDLISFRHPLVRAAVRWFDGRPGDRHRFGAVRLSTRPPGEWLVVVHLVHTSGLRPSLELWPIAVSLDDLAVDDDIGFALLEQTARGDLDDGPAIGREQLLSAIDAAEDELHARQIRIERERRQGNEALVDARIAAQRVSIEAKIERVRSTLAKVTAPNLVRLYRGRIANLQSRLVEVSEELDQRRGLAVTSHPVAVVAVTGGHGGDVLRS